MVTVVGATTNWISFSTTIAGSPSGPTGDVVYLQMQEIEGSFTNESKISNIAGGSSFSSKIGKYKNEIVLRNGIIYIEEGSDSDIIVAFNRRIAQLMKWKKSGTSPIYLIADPDGSSSNLSLMVDNSDTVYDYCKGNITDIDWRFSEGEYKIDMIRFQECLN